MTKKKSGARIAVTDGMGGMREVADLRFEKGDWPIRLEVPLELSDSWLTYLSAECRRRAWHCTVLTQLDSQQNSGTIEVHMGLTGHRVECTWDRKRNGPLRVRARSAGGAGVADVEAFLRLVTDACNAGVKESFFFRRTLEYSGLPWKGEIWLSDRLRLGPASRSYNEALLGPRVIIVDALVEGVDWQDAGARCSVLLREVSAFLSVLMRREVRIPETSRLLWTWTVNENGAIALSTAQSGYQEVRLPGGMPDRGSVPQVPVRAVNRPDLNVIGAGITAGDTEQWLPADTVSLWTAATTLSPERREQFFEVASIWQLANSLSHQWETASYALLVVACEALKPQGARFQGCNIYDVIEGLLGRKAAQYIRNRPFHPQSVRNAHLHRGEVYGTEFSPHMFFSSYTDPAFAEAKNTLWLFSAAAIVEWLRHGGNIAIKHRSRRLGLKKQDALLAGVLIAVGILAGWILAGLLM